MNTTKIILVLTWGIFTLCSGLNAQHKYQEGFDLLENGAFGNASEFFEKALLESPDDVTAQICYGRAIGLSSNPAKAIEIFKALDLSYPENLEIRLNLAESYLWNNEAETARLIYESILVNTPDSFAGNLGYANALSILEKYDLAFSAIEKTLIIEPNHPSALNSKKYILLGQANQYRIDKDYFNATQILSSLNQEYKNDQDVLLSLANLSLETKDINLATSYFQEMVEHDLKRYDAYLGLSYCALLSKKFDKSIDYADLAVANSPNVKSEQIRAGITKVNAIAAKGLFQKARAELQELELTYQSDLQIDLAKARLMIWDREPQKALNMYQFLNQSNPENFEIKMGLAESYIGLKNRKLAQSYILQALEIIPGQTDAQRLFDRLDQQNNSSLEIGYFNANDIGKNKSQVFSARLNHHLAEDHKAFISFENRDASQSTNESSANLKQILVGNLWQANAKTSVLTSAGVSLNQSNVANNTAAIYKAEIKHSPNKHADLTLGANKEIHNYNVDLINSEIGVNHFYLNGNFSLKNNFGIYSQFIHTRQTDQNQRNLLFTSFYNTINKQAGFKVGANLLYFFYNEKNIRYFSPGSFSSAEGFFQLSNIDNQETRFIYHGFLGLGLQQIERETLQFTKRIEIKAGYRLTQKSKLLIEYMSSDAAQSTATGFSISSLGGRLIWQF